MAEHFRFFNNADGHSEPYLASHFAEYFSRFLSDGLYTEGGKTGLQVSPDTDMQVQVATGYAYVRGYMYHNDALMTLPIDPADSMLDRIDRVVLRFDEVAREIRLNIKKGALSSAPIAPALADTATVKELSLARILVRKGTVSITLGSITDERLTAVCGLVSSLIDIPIQEMWDAWGLAMTDIQAAWDQQSNGINDDWGVLKAAWQAWFDSVQNDLGVRVMIGSTEPPGLAAGDLWLKEV